MAQPTKPGEVALCFHIFHFSLDKAFKSLEEGNIVIWKSIDVCLHYRRKMWHKAPKCFNLDLDPDSDRHFSFSPPSGLDCAFPVDSDLLWCFVSHGTEEKVFCNADPYLITSNSQRPSIGPPPLSSVFPGNGLLVNVVGCSLDRQRMCSCIVSSCFLFSLCQMSSVLNLFFAITGNPERGWNDPPVLLHSGGNLSSSQPTQKRSLLNKRVAFPVLGAGSRSSALPAEHDASLPPPVTAGSLGTLHLFVLLLNFWLKINAEELCSNLTTFFTWSFTVLVQPKILCVCVFLFQFTKQE